MSLEKEENLLIRKKPWERWFFVLEKVGTPSSPTVGFIRRSKNLSKGILYRMILFSFCQST
ncbi:hypothetical protein DLM78_20525 [Leptospira stimsonii]|uniref:Uncharacterized protein n=1 Tax=Leptospira stimsonii TaxID=2202203 RepID=A0A8B3CKD3_9LEPT|nr:hypothetical protein DLM78_20525 [Leptospira stimsonii]